MKTINLYLLRHGKTLGAPALNGRTDVLVDPQVQDQIAQSILKKQLCVSTLVTSPLKRCSDLAYRIKRSDPNMNCKQEPRFSELDFGDWDGVSFDELQGNWAQLEAFWQDPAKNTLPGAELLEHFHHRVANAWADLLEDIEGDTLIIAHGGTIRLILAHVLNVDWSNPSWYSSLNIANQSITHIKLCQIETGSKRQWFQSVTSISQPL